LEDAIVLEEMVRFDPPKPENDGIENSENFFGDTIAIVPLGKPKMTIEENAKVDLVDEFLEERQAAEVGQTPSRKFDF